MVSPIKFYNLDKFFPNIIHHKTPKTSPIFLNKGIVQKYDDPNAHFPDDIHKAKRYPILETNIFSLLSLQNLMKGTKYM
jgi:hypothetical protein